jgi:drug/metabolite transporter (DMT)-like permease
MSPLWIYLALSSTLIASFINLLDSHILTRRISDWRAYVLICDLFTLPISLVMLVVFPLPQGIGVTPFLALFGASVTSTVATILILQAMKSEDIARISPLTSTSPVFVAILAMIFLSEAISLRQWLAIGAVVTGVIGFSLKWDGGGPARFHTRPILLLSAASLLIAVGAVCNKYALGYMSYWNSAALLFLITSLMFISMSLRRDVVRHIASLPQRGTAISLALGNQAIGIFASVLSFWAVKLGPVAMVYTIYTSKPVFIFAFAAVAGRLAPGFLLRELGNRKLAVSRAAATLLVVGGLIAMLSYRAG